MTTIQLTGADINGDQTSCSVAQFLLIFGELAKFGAGADLTWYGADMSPSVGCLEEFSTGSASRVGSFDDMTRLFRSLTIPQIDFGVLIAVAAEKNAPEPTQMFSAEGPGGRRYASSEIEMLAFDDTYIEITSDRPLVSHGLITRFPTARIIDQKVS